VLAKSGKFCRFGGGPTIHEYQVRTYATCFVYEARVYYTLMTIRRRLLLVRIVVKLYKFC